MNQVIAALVLITVSIAGGAILWHQSSTVKAADPRPPFTVSYVGYYNNTHQIYYVVDGCVKGRGTLMTWDPDTSQWIPADTACEGALILASLSDVLEGLPTWQAEVIK